MISFENQIQKLSESGDEFMLDLVKLKRAASLDSAVKRKFLVGVSPSLKRAIFVFCQDPYVNGISRDALLQHCRKDKVQLQLIDEYKTYAKHSAKLKKDETHTLTKALNDFTLR